MELHSPVIWLLLFSYAGAGIKILNEGIAMECGRNFTLTCKTVPSATSVAWMFYGDVIPIAKYYRKIRKLHPKYVKQYNFAFDVEQGIYNLTIKNLTRSVIGRTFVCSSGDESASEILRLKDYKALLLEDKEKNEIIATSGYISPDTNVMFKWIKIDADDKQESDFHPQILNTSAKNFSDIFVCSTDELTQHSRTISAKPSLSGRYYLKIVVMYGNETVIFNVTTLKYNIEEQDLSNSTESDTRKEARIRLDIIIPVVLSVILTPMVFCIKKYRTRCLSKCRKDLETCFPHVEITNMTNRVSFVNEHTEGITLLNPQEIGPKSAKEEGSNQTRSDQNHGSNDSASSIPPGDDQDTVDSLPIPSIPSTSNVVQGKNSLQVLLRSSQ